MSQFIKFQHIKNIVYIQPPCGWRDQHNYWKVSMFSDLCRCQVERRIFISLIKLEQTEHLLYNSVRIYCKSSAVTSLYEQHGLIM